MKKKIFMLSLLLGLSLLTLFWPQEKTQKTIAETLATSQDPLIKAFHESESNFKSLKLKGWVKVNNNFESMENLNNIISTIDQELDFALARLKRTETNEQYFRGINLIGSDQGYQIEVNIQTVKGTTSTTTEPETYVVINLERTTLDFDYERSYSQIKKGLQRLAPNPQYAAVITGGIKQALDQGAREQKIKTIFESAKAEGMDIINAQNLTSATGYTPELKDAIKVGQQKVNLNVALRYNHLEQTTYIFIGRPIILIEY